MLAIEAHGLHKTFPGPLRLPGLPARGRPAVTAVAGVDLAVAPGERFTLLGPNGAGKTTLIKLLCTLITPSGGQARVLGHDLRDGRAIRAAAGLVVADERSFYWRLSGRQNLQFFAALHGLDRRATDRRVAALLEQVGLAGAADERFMRYSTGMRQRLAIARGLLHAPRLLFLDEPTRSLDPRATAEIHALIRALAAGGATIFLTTHDLAEAEALGERVAIMHRGRIRASAPPGELRRRLRPGERCTLVVDRLPAAARAGLAALAGSALAGPLTVEPLAVEPADGEAGTRVALTFHTNGSATALTAALDLLRAHGVAILSARGEPPTLEEVFAHFTAEDDEDAGPEDANPAQPAGQAPADERVVEERA